MFWLQSYLAVSLVSIFIPVGENYDLVFIINFVFLLIEYICILRGLKDSK